MLTFQTMLRIVAGVTALIVSVGSAAHAAVTISGTVFADHDGDGLLSAGDAPVPGAVVVWETTVFARADGLGRYSLQVPSDGIIWVRTPDGFSPAPVWRKVAVSQGARTIDLPLTPRLLSGPVTFVHGSDLHIGGGQGIDEAAANNVFDQVALTEPRAHFVVVTGDLTQANEPEQFQVVKRAVDGLGVPFVPVPGNHDWYDGGTAYRANMGPPTYSFDAGGVHFVVLDESLDPPVVYAFLEKDASFAPAGTPIALFVHYPPALEGDDPFVDGLKARGVRWLFTGHWHQNRVLHERGLPDYNMQPMIMGGMDQSPGGWRLVTIEGDTVRLSAHTTVEKPVFRVTSPLPDGCVPPGPVEIIAVVETGATPVTVAAQIDGAPARALDPRGGWDLATTVALDGEGDHGLTVTLDRPGLERQRLDLRFCTRATARPSAPLTDWPQLQGGPTHTGATSATVMPPLQTLWATSVGGHLRGGSPVLAGGRLFVPVVDLGDGAQGGVVALDAVTGEQLWQRRVGRSVNNAPAVANGTVVIGISDGVVEGLAADTGAVRWQFDVADGLPEGASNLYAAPTIADGVVYIGVVRNMAALDLATGAPLWQKNPSTPPIGLDLTYAALSVSSGVVVGLFGRGYEGIGAYDALTGATLWHAPADLSLATSASPIIVGNRVFSGNSATVVYQLDLLSGRLAWDRQLKDAGWGWGYWIAATPAYAGGKLFVPTQADDFYALRDDSGAQVWKISADTSVLHPVHYRGASQAFSASPIVTGEVVWIGGADGILRAVDAEAGSVLWSQDLGAPILSGPVPASPLLFVGTWDGTMRALVAVPGPLQPKPDKPTTGCAIGGATSSAAPLPIALLVLLVLQLLRSRASGALPCSRGWRSRRSPHRR
jgi:outer membrane protein assembly factor BamB